MGIERAKYWAFRKAEPLSDNPKRRAMELYERHAATEYAKAMRRDEGSRDAADAGVYLKPDMRASIGA
jgi:hypothetical protein